MSFKPEPIEDEISSSRPPPPWEVVVLVANCLDPKNLATASCVCKTWFSCFSSDRQWESICRAEFPSVSNLKSTHPSVPYRTLYSLGFSAAQRRRQTPPKPSLTLSDLIFSIDILSTEPNSTSSKVEAHLSISGEELERGRGDDDERSRSLFQFDVVLGKGGGSVEMDEMERRVKVVWNIVLKGWRGVFCLMECEGKVGAGGEGWFSAEAVAAGCCCRDNAAAGSGLMGDLRLGFCRDADKDNELKVVKVSMGLLSSVSWRYVCMDDALRYLQHFV
ncbi:hypothetical protein QQ045_003481 [Rhodiola kirilowii]